MSDTVHRLASVGFGAAADAYERARPDYPADAVAEITGRLDLRPGRVVLELGAGTGKMTRQLVPSGARVLAVEPVAAMRARLVAAAPGAEVIDGTAEAIPLPAGSVDGAIAAQAFHWFDTVRALSELHRVIRPGGALVLAWNMRDETVPWVRRLGELLDAATGGEAPSYQHGWSGRVARCGLFEPLTRVSFPHAQQLTVEGVIDRAASISTVAAAEPATRDALFAEIRALLGTDPETAGRDIIELPYTTYVHRAARLGPAPGRDGRVASVNASDGGVPKLPVDGARIRRLGLDGDGHADPAHGGEGAAVCLYAQEAVERVRADGHQAFPGAFGENLTLLGIDWGALRAGDRVAIGDDGVGPLLELTREATPCRAQARWFTEARIARISHKVHPEDARWYARVLREGDVRPGMPVRIEPAG